MILRRLFGRGEVPTSFVGRLDPDERVLATATVPGERHCLATNLGIWVLGEDGPLRIGWHLVSKAVWKDGVLALVLAEEVADIDGVVLIEDRGHRRLRLVDPGRVPEVVHERVTSSIRSRHHRELPGGGAWFVQRKVPGRDGIVLQVRPDPGTDPVAVRNVTAQVARTLGRTGSGGHE